MNNNAARLPQVVADGPLSDAVTSLLAGRVEALPWEVLAAGEHPDIEGIYTFGHPRLDGAVMDRTPNARVISNYGVGVDHVVLADAAIRGISVGNTPGVLDGATADLGWTLMMAAARRLSEGDRYARSPEFTTYDPCFMLGREVHGATLGIVGLGRIGREVARRASGFDMRVLYYNRHRREEVERELAVEYRNYEQLLEESDFVMLCVPLTPETTGLVDAAALSLMKSTAVLINIARGAVVDAESLTAALQNKQLYAAALDVTEPEPLPRDHPLLKMPNVLVMPHLGSATVQTRQRMAELSVANLLAGLEGRPLQCQVG